MSRTSLSECSARFGKRWKIENFLYVVLKVHDTLIQYSSLAQSVEHSAVNRVVVGSSPTGGAWKARKSTFTGFFCCAFFQEEGKSYGIE